MANVKFHSYLNARVKEVNSAADTAVIQSGHMLRTAWLKKLKGPRTGRRYRVPGTNVFYTDSAAGEAPARRTGDMARSITFDFEKQGRTSSYYLGTPLLYPYFLEFGFMHHSGVHVSERPSLMPTFIEMRETVKALCRRIMNKEMSGVRVSITLPDGVTNEP
jgi:hypothetical protein